MNRVSKTMKVIIAAIILMMIIQLPLFSRSRRGSNYSAVAGIEIDSLSLADGTYRGTATGFRPGLIVEILIKDGELLEVEVVEHNEIGRQFYVRPINLVPGVIVEEQQTDVDSVSGATATSKAIMAAVEDALQKAMLE
ncbi:MAG: FMN-binding protein [Spirochaetales bacterium]|nr:FMN-binding protein [Spirochaetales bacterium]